MYNCLMRLKVLIIDYDQFQADLLEAIVTEAGHNAGTTIQPEEGLHLVTRACTENNPYDLIFVEFMLPGTTGIELGEKLLAVDPTLTVIMATADNSIETRRLIAQSGKFAGFINKAADVSHIQHHLNIAMSNKKTKLSGEKSEYLKRMNQNKNDNAS